MIAHLMRVRSLLRSGWSRYAHARDIYGQVTSPESDDAKSWCIYGAIRRAKHELGPCDGLEQRLEAVNPYAQNIMAVNDWEGRIAILSIVELAVAATMRAEAA